MTLPDHVQEAMASDESSDFTASASLSTEAALGLGLLSLLGGVGVAWMLSRRAAGGASHFVVIGGQSAPRVSSELRDARVLHIGDSHTAGIYGTELHRLMRDAGTSIDTYASSGSSPSWWLDGRDTHSGYVAMRGDQPAERPTWNVAHATPKLVALLGESSPTVVVVSLGANLRGSSAAEIKKQVDALASVIGKTSTRLVWVGPPNTKATAAAPASDEAFYSALQAAVAPYGDFIDSRPFTPVYSGADGLHYSGTEGTRLAKAWAGNVFAQLHASALA